jgi:hypothetical protein
MCCLVNHQAHLLHLIIGEQRKKLRLAILKRLEQQQRQTV